MNTEQDKKNNLPAKIRLKNALHVSALFAKSDAYSVFPLKILWREVNEGSTIRAAFSVPKRAFKRAVKRNLLRRRMKEAFRKHRHELEALLVQEEMHVEAVILYVGKQLSDYSTIEQSTQHYLKLVANKCRKRAAERAILLTEDEVSTVIEETREAE